MKKKLVLLFFAVYLNYFSNAQVPKGHIETFEFRDSKIYPGTIRQVGLYISYQLDPATPACVYVAQDGYNNELINMMDTLINNKEIPVMVGIFIWPGVVHSPLHGGDSRSNRCYEYDNLGDAYVNFLLDEILPYVSKKYNLNLSRNGNDRCIGGCSSGAICAFNAAWERPDAFRRIYSISGSYVSFRGGNILPTLVRKYEAKPLRIFLHVATNDMENSAGSWLHNNLEMERALAFSGYDYKYLRSEGQHCDMALKAFPDAMRWLWRDYPSPILANPGPPRIQDILIPGEGWSMVSGDFKSAGSLAATANGDVFVCDATANRIYKIDTNGKASKFSDKAMAISGLACNADGRLYGISELTRKIFAFSFDGKPTIIAKRVKGSSLIPLKDGGFYITGRQKNEGKIWLISKAGKLRLVDSGLRNATGGAVSTDGWRLHVADGDSHWVYSFTIAADGSLLNKEHLHWLHVPDNADNSGAGAICFDSTGLLFAATRMGIQTNDSEGHNQCVIPIPEGNMLGLCFGGPEFNWLFASNGHQVFMRKVKVRGHHIFHPASNPSFGGL